MGTATSRPMFGKYPGRVLRPSALRLCRCSPRRSDKPT
jgi:hypothetical protein